MNIKKQIRTLYIYEMISGLQIVDLVWVLFLIQQGSFPRCRHSV